MSFPLKELINVLSKPQSAFGFVVSVSETTISIATKTGNQSFNISAANYPVRKGDRVVIQGGVVKLTRLVEKVIPL
jgi:NMD protein affecting ribosome stability and mRNA decay